MWRPAAAPLLGLFLGIFGRLVESAAQRTATLTYAVCKPCIVKSRNRDDLMKATVLGAVVALLAAATVGFNGHPAIGIAMCVVGAAIVVLIVRALGRGFMRVGYIHGDGTIHLQGVSPTVARLAIENRRDAAGERLGDDDDDDDDDDA